MRVRSFGNKALTGRGHSGRQSDHLQGNTSTSKKKDEAFDILLEGLQQ